MTQKERLLRGNVHSEHIVQFFDSAESLATGVSRFIGEALDDGCTVIAVVRGRNWPPIKHELQARGNDIERAVRTGRCALYDAEELLAQFLRNGVPSQALFHKTVASTVERLAMRGRSLRIYGEMVEVLAEEGNFAGAHALETLWNELALQHAFVLMCGYSSAHFTTRATREAFETICRAHTHVQRCSDDPLAEWLLADSRGSRRSSLRTRRVPA
jgi:MEDS: MEthanogen/methylotroph, DcmR Sensory domain